MSEDIRPGMRVLPVSGMALGEVLSVAGDRFELSTDGERMWISMEAVFTVDDGRVTLICTPDGLKRYEIAAPGQE